MARTRSKTPAGSVWARLRISRLRRDEKGATAVEFGLVAIPFIVLLFAILETALVFFAGQTMETAVSNAARLIRTGQAQQQALSATDFKDKICEQVMSLFDCQDGLFVEVRKFDTFDTIDLSKPIDENGKLKTDFEYSPGNGGDIVVVRAFYEWPVFVKMLGLDLSNMSDGSHLLTATTAFKNEPFPW
jgi:Flp pilus assembly protein TadG